VFNPVQIKQVVSIAPEQGDFAKTLEKEKLFSLLACNTA
jgi:hypothetical protein